MQSKTKIVVLHMKELVYTAIFAILGILFIVLLILMFSDDKKEAETETPSVAYVPGVYTSTLLLGENSVQMEIVLDENHINSIRLLQLEEAVTTMYPLIEPALESLAAQIYETQSLENITYSDDNRYTSSALMEAISKTIEKAAPDKALADQALQH